MFSAILWRYFCVFSENWFWIFFFLFNGITCCWGTLKPVLHSGEYRQINVHVLFTLSSEENFSFCFQIFFSGIYLSAILEIFIENIFWHFSWGICVCVVSVNTNVFYSCCDNISTFPALVEIFFLWIYLSGHRFFGKLILEFIPFFLLLIV